MKTAYTRTRRPAYPPTRLDKATHQLQDQATTADPKGPQTQPSRTVGAHPGETPKKTR